MYSSVIHAVIVPETTCVTLVSDAGSSAFSSALIRKISGELVFFFLLNSILVGSVGSSRQHGDVVQTRPAGLLSGRENG
jgi:hypothetical protein